MELNSVDMAQSAKKVLIVGVHGINNKPEKAQLEEWWKASIVEGLNLQSYQASADRIEFRAVY
jgi:hypothetical protein